MTKPTMERLEDLAPGQAPGHSTPLAAAMPWIGAESDPLCLALNRALQETSRAGDSRILNRALDEIGEVNISVGQFGLTPLIQMLRTEGRSLGRLELFLAHGARVNMRAEDGSTPLHAVVGYRAGADPDLTSITRGLVAAGADMEARDRHGWTPLLRACAEGSLAEMRALLGAGADPDASCGSSGHPALVLAAANPDKVAALLQAGATPGRPMLEMIRHQIHNKGTDRGPGQGTGTGRDRSGLRASLALLTRALPH